MGLGHCACGQKSSGWDTTGTEKCQQCFDLDEIREDAARFTWLSTTQGALEMVIGLIKFRPFTVRNAVDWLMNHEEDIQ